MATILPRSFALKSNKTQKYLRYMHQRMDTLDGLVQPCEEDFKSEYAKFQMQPADGYVGLVHIKCCFNNKYLRRANEHQSWIVAGANEPEEDKTRWSCTLFKPVVVHSDNKAVIRLFHGQLGYSLMPFCGTGYIVEWYPEPIPGNVIDVFTVVDLEPLPLPSPFVLKSNNNDRYLRHKLDQETDSHEILQFSEQDCTSDFAQIKLEPLPLPSPFVLKSNNNDRYLRYKLDEENDSHEILQFSEQDCRSEFAMFKVEQANSRDHQNNQYVHIKCLYNDKYLIRMDTDPLSILPAADSRNEHTDRWNCTLFKPESVGRTGNNHTKMVCRLRHVETGLYTKSNVDNKFELRLGQKTIDPHQVDVYTAIRTHT